jgi:gamma-glutamyltranspeptidase/glutathione hydrolase
MADFFDVLAHEGDDLFYKGEIAQSIESLSQQHGGHLTRDDLESYRSVKRQPLRFNYRDATIFTNPPPSSGGLLIGFTLDLLNQTDAQTYGSNGSLHTLLTAMALTHEARINSHEAPEQILNPELLQTYRQQFTRAVRSYRGTTHISVIDEDGNVASLTTSNGEGCGYLIPDTGIMLNNMLGEEDLHPQGFNNWPTNQRMTSMMSPSFVIDANHREIVLGSGGSNRIRSAITQVLLNIIDHNMSIEDAVEAPRIHLEKSHLNIEGGYSEAIIDSLTQRFPQPTIWNELNLFFGGVHTVMRDGQQFSGHGDPRRGGYAVRI